MPAIFRRPISAIWNYALFQHADNLVAGRRT